METDNQESQPLPSDTQASPEPSSTSDAPFSEQSLDDHLEAEQAQIEELNQAEDEETDDPSEDAEAIDGEEESEGESEDAGEYKPNPKYKVLDEEHEFDPKLKKLLSKETEPIIRELYEKAHGIDAIKNSRAAVTRERDEVRQQHQGLLGEVGRVLNYKKSGDLQSFFESVQLSDDDVAKYILEKVRISQLPPEQQSVYNEREALRRRMNSLEQNFQTVQANGANAEVEQRLTQLDQALGSEDHSRLIKDFDTRNGKGAFREAVMNHGALQFTITKKDLSPADAVKSFVKTMGLSVPKGQPKPGADATRRVVARPKVKTIPNYGGSQASVTATRKPKSIDDLKAIRREKFGS